MKEEIEKLNIEKEKKQEKTAIEELRDIKIREEEKRKEDKIYSSPWHVIKPDKLSSGLVDLYDDYRKGELEVAQSKLLALGEKIEKEKNKETKENNQKFFRWINEEIVSAFSQKKTNEFKQQDNVR